MKTTKSRLTAADYDFSEVPDNELVACHWYEYARESKAARDEIASGKQQNKQNQKNGSHEICRFSWCDPARTGQVFK